MRTSHAILAEMGARRLAVLEKATEKRARGHRCRARMNERMVLRTAAAPGSAMAVAALASACSIVFSSSTPDGNEAYDAGGPLVEGNYYISPEGDDGNEGDRPEAPFRTWEKALSQLIAGETLVVMPGVYSDVAVAGGLPTGLPNIDCNGGGDRESSCGGGCQEGTGAARIRVVAQRSRTAILEPSNDWEVETLRLDDCSFWTIEGLVVRGPETPLPMPDPSEVPSEQRRVVRVSDSPNTILRDMLVHRDYKEEGTLLSIDTSRNLLLEDSGFYDFHNKALVVFTSVANEFRRIHISGENRSEAPDTSDCVGLGDVGIQVSGSPNASFDNAIIESVCQGFTVEPRPGPGTPADRLSSDGVTVFGSIVNATQEGIQCENDCQVCLEQEATVDAQKKCCDNQQSCRDFRVANSLVLSANDEGIQLRTPTNALIERVTLYDIGNVGIEIHPELVDDTPLSLLPSNPSAEVVATLIVGTDLGIDATGLPTTEVRNSSIITDTGSDFVPDELFLDNVNLDDEDPTTTGCLAVPSTDWVSARPVGDLIVGADIRYRSVNGTESTDEPLWTEVGFPCGVLVPGVNDSAGGRCDSIHTRYGIGAPDCLVP